MSAPRTLTFFGGAATATGSMMLLEAAGARVLIDAGLFQGDLDRAEERNRDLPLDPSRIDAILLSQPGLAHAGRLPQLVRHGYQGPIYATPAARAAAAVLLTEAALELERQGEGALYGLDDVFATHGRIVGQPHRRPLHLRRNLVFSFADAGHMLGSASIELRTGEGGTHRIVYGGCVGRPGSRIFPDPEVIAGEVDTLIVGSPFAHTSHLSFDGARKRLAGIINDAVTRSGQIIVPSASIGPVHEFVRAVQDLFHQGEIPGIPIWFDTPTPVSLPTLLRMHPEALGAGVAAYREHDGPFDSSLLHYVETDADRAALEALAGSAIIIAENETGNGGRSAGHLRRCLGEERHTVVFLSFQEEGSLGQMLLDGVASAMVGGVAVEPRARVELLHAFSGFADGEEMRGWLRALGGPVRRAFVVQGDDLAVATMVTILREEGVHDVIVPRLGESFPF